MGEEELLERLGNPFWFQGFSNIIGMDWDSSGSTTVVIHILKQVLEPGGDGLAVLGGKGGEWATAVPTELRGGLGGGEFDVDADALERASSWPPRWIQRFYWMGIKYTSTPCWLREGGGGGPSYSRE